MKGSSAAARAEFNWEQVTDPEQISYPVVALWVTCLHCLYVVTWYLQLGSRQEFLDAIRFEFLLGACLVFLCLFFLPITRPSSFQNKILGPLRLFIVFLVVGLFISEDLGASWDMFVDHLIKYAFMGLFAVAFVRSPRQLKWFVAAFMLAWLKIEEEAFRGILTGSMIWENQGVPRLHGTTGMYLHPNSLAGLALGSIPFAYYLFPVMPLAGKVVLAVQAALGITTVIYTGSRTGYIGLAFFLIFLLKDSRYKFKMFIGMCTLLLLLANFAPPQYWLRFETIFTGVDKEGNSTGTRKEILQDAIEVLNKHPFGVGVGSFPAVRYRYFGRIQDTHNLYLEVATNLGVQGLVAFVILIYAILKGLSHLKRSFPQQLSDLEGIKARSIDITYDKHVKDLKLMEATARAVFAFLLIRLVLGFFGHDLYEVYWWFALGLTLTLLNMNVWASARTAELIALHGGPNDASHSIKGKA